VSFRVGDRTYPLMAILEGEVAVLDAAGNEIVRHGAPGFLGEMNLLSGQTVFLTARATKPLRYIAVEREALRPLLFEDGPLSGLVEFGAHGIGDPKNLILFVGFQAEHTLGRRIQAGQETVRILGQEYERRAEVESISGYSAHADRDELRSWVRRLGGPIRRAFVVHGEPPALEAMAEGVPVVAYAAGALPETLGGAGAAVAVALSPKTVTARCGLRSSTTRRAQIGRARAITQSACARSRM